MTVAAMPRCSNALQQNAPRLPNNGTHIAADAPQQLKSRSLSYRQLLFRDKLSSAKQLRVDVRNIGRYAWRQYVGGGIKTPPNEPQPHKLLFAFSASVQVAMHCEVDVEVRA
jgi:hypothetical protein